VLLTTPLPRWFLLVARLFAGVTVSLFQVYTFLLVAYFFGVELPHWGYLAALPALILTGMMFGALGMLVSSTIKQLENFAGIMNFVIFPMFFASSALYPLWRLKEANDLLHDVAAANPFTHAVELIRFALYGAFNGVSAAVVLGATGVQYDIDKLIYLGTPDSAQHYLFITHRHAGLGTLEKLRSTPGVRSAANPSAIPFTLRADSSLICLV